MSDFVFWCKIKLTSLYIWGNAFVSYLSPTYPGPSIEEARRWAFHVSEMKRIEYY